jgi:integrase
MTETTKVRITQKLIAELPITGYDYLKFDDDLIGFGVAVSKRGVKTFVAERRLKGAAHKTRAKIERCNIISVDEARNRARVMLDLMRQGINPKTKPKQSLTLQQSLDDMIARQAEPYAKNTIRSYRNDINHLPKWLALPMNRDNITTEMVETRYREIKKEVAAKAKPRRPGLVPITGKAQANATMRVLNTVWNYRLVRDASIGPNPSAILKGQKYRQNNFARALPEEHHAAFYAAALELEKNDLFGSVAVRVLMWAGFRGENVQELEWTEIKRNGFIEIDEAKSKTPGGITHPIDSYLEELFDKLLVIGQHSSGYLFPGHPSFGGKKREHPHMTTLAQKVGVIGDKIGIILSPHNLRNTYTTVCEDAPIGLLGQKILCGHAIVDQTQKYQLIDYLKGSRKKFKREGQIVANEMARRCGLLPPRPEAEDEEQDLVAELAIELKRKGVSTKDFVAEIARRKQING